MKETEGAPLLDDAMHPLASAFEFAFGCHHTKLSRVFTIEGRSYKVCCDCGATFDYSFQTMSVVPRRTIPVLSPPGDTGRKVRSPLYRSSRQARAFAYRLARRLMSRNPHRAPSLRQPRKF